MSKKRHLMIWCIVICMVFPIMSPILAYAEETDAVIKFNDEEHYLSVEPYENDLGLMINACEAANVLGLSYETDTDRQTFTVTGNSSDEFVFMNNATEYFNNDMFYDCDPCFYMEQGIPMIELGFFCSLFNASYEYDKHTDTISISKNEVIDDTPSEGVYLSLDELPQYSPVLMAADDETSDMEENTDENSHKLKGSITLTTDKYPDDGLDVRLILQSSKEPVYLKNYNANPTYDLGTIHLENGKTAEFTFDTDKYFTYDYPMGLMYLLYTDSDVQKLKFVTPENNLLRAYSEFYLGNSPKRFFWCKDNKVNLELAISKIAEGSCGENASWQLDTTDGTLHISGSGSITSSPWTKSEYYDMVKSVIIDPGITYISKSAFEGCVNLTDISIPDSVTAIGERAFYNCISLTDIALPNRLKYISKSTFYNCIGLTSINIPDTVASIDQYAFLACSNLSAINVSSSNETYSSEDGVLFNKSKDELVLFPTGKAGEYTIPDGVVTINDSAFSGCTSLTGIHMPDSITNISDHAFAGCINLTDVTLSNNITNIYRSAFYNCQSLTKLEIPDGVTTIWYEAFSGCTSLASITIPDSVTTIDSYAFSRCKSLTSVALPDNLRYIEDYVFMDCTSLTDVTIPGKVVSIDNYAFIHCTSLTGISMPDSITSIGTYAFADCTSLESVVVPKNVKTISSFAFADCTSLTSVTLSNGIQRIGSCVFSDCTSLTDVKLSDSLQTIGKNAFYNCMSLENIDIPNSVTKIYSCAFKNCKELKNATIPANVKTVDGGIFAGCTSLNEINVHPSNGKYCSENGILFSKDKSILVCYPAGRSGEYTIPDSVTTIDSYAFSGCTLLSAITIPDTVTKINYGAFSDCTALSNIIIPDSITEISYGIFRNCTALESVSIPDTVTEILSNAFCNCTALTSFTAPKSLTYIYDFAFSGCSALRDVTLSDGVKRIYFSAFADCTSLTNIELPDTLQIIGGNAFENCSSLTNITFPDSLIGIDNGAFKNCSKLKSITLPDNNIRSVYSEVFENCTDLERVVIPETVTRIGTKAFHDCRNLKDVYYAGTKAQWNDIYFYDRNAPLYIATIHYGKVSTNTVHTINDDGTITLNITLPDMEIPQTAKVYAIGMDGSRLSTMTGKSASSDESLTLSADKVKKVKVFVWDENMKPLTTAEEIEIQ